MKLSSWEKLMIYIEKQEIKKLKKESKKRRKRKSYVVKNVKKVN